MHGGQIRFPFVGGLLAPGQGFFPKSTEGVYTKDGTQMVFNRGLDNSIFSFRININPEIVVVTVRKTNIKP